MTVGEQHIADAVDNWRKSQHRFGLELGLSQAELAARARVSRQWVSAFESGKATAEVGLVIRLLDALELRMTVAEAGAPAAARGPAPVDLDALLDQQRSP